MTTVIRDYLGRKLLAQFDESASYLKSGRVAVIPISAFRLVPLQEKDSAKMTVDGELMEYGPVQGRILPGYGHFMSARE